MDSKTPPIPLKEKPKPKQQETVVNVSLPPLTSYSYRHRQKQKISGTHWSRDVPNVIPYQDHQRKRPYRVLQIGATPLMHACQQSDRARVLRLLKEQEDTIGFRDRTLRNALHYCMDAGTVGAVASAAPELVNAPDAEGHTPLHLAVIAGDTQLVAVLLANGADVNAKDLEGHSVLHWATVCGEAECVRLVLAAGARPSTPDLRGGSPLHYAAQCCGAAATAELAVPKRIGLKVLQTLLEFGADVNAKDEDGRQPILWAASAGSVEAVLALARAGGSAAAGAADKDGLTALHCAASRGHANCVEALLNLCGAHPDHVDDNGCSALHYAATLGHADVTALILKLGADPNRQDRKGRTPALCAAAKGQLETLKILAQHGGSLYARTVRGTGVAHEAVASGRIELIKWLAKKRSSTLDVATHDGKTPLHVAALHGYLDACKVLLDNGARINAMLRTSKGNLMTALDAALYRGHRDCAKLIQMHGGTTAQQLKMHKAVPNKVFATSQRLRHVDSSTDTESSPRRGNRVYKQPDVYYEEQWVKKRIRRRGSSKKLARQDSRSFSEEEVRLSKTSTNKNYERRTRSESARYEGDDTDYKFRRKKSKKKSTSSRRDESSMDSDSYEHAPNTSRQELESRVQESKLTKNNETREMKGSRWEEKGDESVSDDSLEVVVVRKRLEKKCEKVVCGKRSKMPRKSSTETKLSKTQHNSQRKLKLNVLKVSDNNQCVTDQMVSFYEQGAKEPGFYDEETVKTFIDESKEHVEKISENRYRPDVVDSTSQETVEQVTVTAMVHKDQSLDTPKSTKDNSREVIFDDKLKTEAIETMKAFGDTDSGVSKMDDIVEQIEGSRSRLVTKAASLKKDVDEMRQQITLEKKQQEGTREERGDVWQSLEDDVKNADKMNVKEGGHDQDVKKEEVSEDLKKEQDEENRETSLWNNEMKQNNDKKGRLDILETNKTECLILDSQPETQQEHGQQKDKVISKSLRTDDNLDKDTHDERADLSEHGSKEEHEGSGGISKFKRRASQNEITALRTVTEDVSVPEEENSKSMPTEIKNGLKYKQVTAKRESSIEETKLKSSSLRQSDTNSTKGTRGYQQKDVIKRFTKVPGKLVEKMEKSSIEEISKTRKLHGKNESTVGETRNSSKEPDKNMQIDTIGKKSVEFSSMLREGAYHSSLNIDTVITSNKKIFDEQYGIQGSSRIQADQKNRSKDNEEKQEFTIDAEIDTLATEEENFRYADESSSSSSKSAQTKQLKPPTSKMKRSKLSSSRSLKNASFESSEERSPDRSAIVAVIESPEWGEENEQMEKEISGSIENDVEHEIDPQEDNEMGVTKFFPSTSEKETFRNSHTSHKTSERDTLPQVQSNTRNCLTQAQSPVEGKNSRQGKQRHDSGGRDSGIEPSPRVSRIPRRRIMKCCPNSSKQQTLNMDTITRDVQISLRRYQLERKIFFQLMELKRLQIRHGKANEHVLVKRQIIIAVDGCGQEQVDLLPKIESRGKGQMTVEVTHGAEKQIITLPAEKLDRTKRYYVTFTVRGEASEQKHKSSHGNQRDAKSV